MRVRLQLYTVPGQVFYNATRQLVLRGADGVVFVADSQQGARDANVEALRNLGENMLELEMPRDATPLVFQYNKRDLKQILSVEDLRRDLNPLGLPQFEAAALHGLGVFETLKGITRAALMGVRRRLDEDGARAAKVPPPPASQTPELPVVNPWVEGRPIPAPDPSAEAPIVAEPGEVTPVEFAEETTGDHGLRAVSMQEGPEIQERLERLRRAPEAPAGQPAAVPASDVAAPEARRATFKPTYELSQRARVRVPRRVLASAPDVAVHLSFGPDVVITDVVVGRIVREPETGRLSLHLDIEIEEQT